MEKLLRKMKTIGIHWKQYVEVKERILALVENDSPYSIETDYQYFPESAIWVVKAKLTMIETGEIFTGLAQEKETDWSINKTSALENAETSAVGRACAFAGIGIVDGIASVDEINKASNREKQTPTGGYADKKWFNYSDLQDAIKEWSDTDIALRQYIKDFGFTCSAPMWDVIKKYLTTGELVKPEFKK